MKAFLKSTVAGGHLLVLHSHYQPAPSRTISQRQCDYAELCGR